MIKQVIFLIFVLTLSINSQTFEGLNLAPFPSSLPSENIGTQIIILSVNKHP